MEIRSYRNVFDLERRIYRVDKLRLNPAGIPLRGIAYFAVLVLAGTVLGRLPLVGALVAAAPWYARELAGPAAMAWALTMLRIEGRAFHVAALAWLRHALAARHLAGLGRCRPAGWRWYAPDMLVLPDGSDSRLRSLRYMGPGRARVDVAHARIERAHRPWSRLARRAEVTLIAAHRRPGASGPAVIVLGRGARMEARR